MLCDITTSSTYENYDPYTNFFIPNNLTNGDKYRFGKPVEEQIKELKHYLYLKHCFKKVRCYNIGW